MMTRILTFFPLTLLRAGFLLSFLLSACAAQTPATVAPTESPAAATESLGTAIYTDPSQPVEARVEELLRRMTLDEKIGQMTQVEKNSIKSGDITKYYIGSILSGGGGSPSENTPQAWYAMVEDFQNEALATRLEIPMIYGVDAVHGHGNLLNATIFPHNIGLGATNNPELLEKIGRATAEEMLATGIPWNFAPVVAVVQDVRWGRTYEGFGEETELVTSLGTAYLRGLQTLTEADNPVPGQSIFVLGTPKHFIGDGATIWDSSSTNDYKLDQGNMQVPEELVRKVYLPPYQSAVDAGAMNVMASFSSWKGTKIHGEQYLLTKVLKDELGFTGFIVSDWQGMDQVFPDDYYASIVTSVNAGVDMNMVPYDYVTFIETMMNAVNNGDIPESRVDEAVRRILRVKFALGLFEQPMPDTKYQGTVRSREHLELARQAVRESLVLLKNEDDALPLDENTPSIFVAGEGANDIGLQSGGWTLEWLGKPGNDNEGTTILSGIRAIASANTRIEYNRNGNFSEFNNAEGNPLVAGVGIVVLAEEPYAEGVGDRADISLNEEETTLITEMGKQSETVVVILISGRPRVITEQLSLAEAWVAAWLPGTEGGGIADVLFGDYPFTGKLSYSWPRSNEQLPINSNNSAEKAGCDAPLFPFGYGLTYGDPSPEILECNP
ncbi:MAG TPA: glycoside hydrolase family 3 N-terminal domain-containing protein [Anaerolineales bacterium]|nr:glycoside hydrolase family 3 N-terminal domain-containing protein [Anaerolineales bacterium]